MKKFSLILCLSFFAFCACDKADDSATGNSDTNGKKLEGRWKPSSMKFTLKFDDGSVVNQTIPLSEEDHTTFVYQKTSNNKSEGTYQTYGLGFASNGTWVLENNNNELSFFSTALDGTAFAIFRKIETITDNQLILTADDRLVVLWAEVNDLNQGEDKKVVGGSAYEVYAKVR
ncbi:MAG: hypothetical protein LCH81_04110 [Bacteroidetes bacterium]|nr:hypothetical protein [Bacteroidota bacterium]